MNTINDNKWMRLALRLAEKGRGTVHPNPMVGAVLIRGGDVVGKGFHRAFGHAHAEVEAIRAAGARARGAILYVTLEPCSHWGKTPPCAEAILKAGIKQVVVAMRDPNPLVAGKGLSLLRRHGVQVSLGVLEDRARDLNRAFITWVLKNRPFVTVKVASSLDGRSSTVTGESHWITGPEARQAGYRIRAQVDAIAVGRSTVAADNPLLTAHGAGRNPIRVLFDSQLKTSLRARIFNNAAPTWCLATHRTPKGRRDTYNLDGVRVLTCGADARGRVAVQDALKRLAVCGVAHLLVEGGMDLQRSFFEAGLVDEVVWFIAPMIIGNARRLKSAWHLGDIQMGRVGKDLCVRARCLPGSFKRSAK